eukprot:408877_1
MLVKKRMNSQQKRSHKGYHNIPIYHAPKRRSGNSPSPEPDSPTLSYPPDNKYDKKWLANKLLKMIGIIIVLLIFLIITIIIYQNMPSGESPLPPENTTKHELHSTMNDIISPQFNVDESITNKIAQINPIQTFQKSTNSINVNSNSKHAIVYFLEEETSNDNFCTLLMSIASTVSSTTSLDNNNIELIVFVHYTFAIDKLNLDALAATMHFKLIKYELNGSLMLEHIIRKLQSLPDDYYDSIIYLNYNVFVLQDLSILFEAISFEKYHFGGIWSFDNDIGNTYKQCLLPAMFIINMNHISKYNLHYKEMCKEQLMCKNRISNGNDNSVINIDKTLLNNIKELSDQYGIVSFPWWYIMDHIQFKTYYGDRSGINEKTNRFNWLNYINFFESKTHTEPIPLLIDLTTFNDINDDLFWNEWSSKHKKSIQFCQNIAS